MRLPSGYTLADLQARLRSGGVLCGCPPGSCHIHRVLELRKVKGVRRTVEARTPEAPDGWLILESAWPVTRRPEHGPP